MRDAITKFLADCDARYLGWEAKRKYRHLLEDRLLSWCDSKGLSNLRDLTVDALRQFRQSWKDSQLYATKNLSGSVPSFGSPAGRVDQAEPGHVREAAESDSEPDAAVLARRDEADSEACDRYGGNKERIRAFVLIMRFTGLRIRDAIRVEALEKAESGSERYFWTGANIRSAVLGLPWGVGIIVGAILAPTDPVLASDVQVEHPFDQNRLRFALTSEASLNDGTAFPFLMLGLGLLGLHDLGSGLWRWVAIDVLWATTGGLGVGGALGTAVGKLVLYMRRTHREAVGLDDFLALGLIALAYGIAVVCHAYGFLAVFAAGLALRRVERVASGRTEQSQATLTKTAGLSEEEVAVHPDKAPAYMAQAVLAFNEQLERIGEIAIVVVVGTLLSADLLTWRVLWLTPLLFVIIRPLSVVVALAGAGVTRREIVLIGWFGVRGVGSVYYLAYAIVHGLPAPFREQVVSLTLVVIAASVLVHGVTVTPLMARWGERGKRVG